MVGPRIYHIKHARSYPAFTADDPAKVMDLAVQWLKRHDFRVKRKSKQYSRGSKKGIHVNFVPKFKLYIEQGPNGHYVVRFDYYAKIKLGTAVVVGVLTSGISTVVGVGTLAIALSDADNFVDKFWKHIDSLARGNPVILTVERWASDGKGGFVKQPLPPGTAVPAGGPPPPRQQPLPPPPPPVYAPPMHTDNRPRDTNPPQIQPGQVYGHSFIPPPVQASAPPPVPQYYPKLEKSNPPPPNNYPPPHSAAYGNYPPPPSPHGHYPPPPSPHQTYGHPPPPPPHAPHSYQPPTPTGHAYPPPPPAHGYPPPPPAHNYQPPPPGGYPPPPSQQGQRAPSQHAQRPPPAQNTQPTAPRRPPPTPQSNYGDSGQASHDGYAAHHDSYSAYYDSHGDRQSYYGGDAATEHSYYAAYTDPNGVYHEASYFEKRASTGSDDIPDSASSFAEQHGLGRYAEHHTNLRSSYYSDTKSQATNPSV